MFALVDNEDFEELNAHKWSVHKNANTFYVQRKQSINGKTVAVLMHAQIMKTPKGFHTDHIDGNGLNNQRSNLRVCTTSENGMNQSKHSNNTSGFKGVSWIKSAKKWRASISVNGKIIHLGSFLTPELASEAYVAACIQYHGEFANY